MTLVERLRLTGGPRECWEAADELERQAGEIERLRGLLRETREFIVFAEDEGCVPGECPECDMTRLADRIDAALTGSLTAP